MLFIHIFSINIYSHDNVNKDNLKIGVYDYEPYVEINYKGDISGYYPDFIDLINEKMNYRYEYVLCNIKEGYEKLKNGDIDILMGVPIAASKNEDIIFNKYPIAEEKFGIYTNKNLDLEELKKFSVVRLGIVEKDYNADWVLDFFEANNIKVETVYSKNYEILNQLMEEDKIDVKIDSGYKNSKYKTIYDFTGQQIYIAGNKDSLKILNNIDKAMESFGPEEDSKISDLYNRYFNGLNEKVLYNKMILHGVLTLLSLSFIAFGLIPVVKKRYIQKKIKTRLDNDRYLLQYQPIYNPRDKSIVGFEGLLRLLDNENKLIPPFKFIPEIENNNMLFEVSLWILKKAIDDYHKIKLYESMKEKNFYISINVSLNEIENDEFIKKSIEMLSESNLGRDKLCLEIIERVKVNDLNKITNNINLLKEAGFKIAIDDFGVEYSNLDVLQKLDVDIIKVDKNFVDGIGKDIIKDETILFISRIAIAKDKSVVLEGIEENEQDINIKKIENDKLYVQGYYYNKPMYVQNIMEI